MFTDPAIPALISAWVNETAPVLAVTLDADWRVVAANAYARRVLGSVDGRELRELVVNFTPLPDLGEGVCDTTHLLTLNTTGGIPESLHFRFFELPRGWLALGSVDMDEQMRLRNEVLELNRELSDLTRQLHQANAELRELSKLKDLFLGMAAHDLRRPISLVMLYSEFLIEEAGDALDEVHRDFLRKCLNAAFTMKQLVDGFLDFAVIESGQLRLDLEWTTASELLNGALEVGRLLANRKGVDLIVETAGGVPVRVDAPKLQQVLVNLLANAVDHSRPGQHVWITSRIENHELIFAVSDEGSGIAPEDQKKLFQPFARAGTRKTAGERSVGLGLAIARQVVEAHRGRVWVESTVGEGATFLVAVPIPPEAGESSES